MPTPLAYALKQTKLSDEKLLDVGKGLTTEDKDTLKEWAREEMTVLCVEIVEKTT